LFWQK